MNDSSIPAVQCRNVMKCYGKTLALNGVDLAIPRGAFFGLLGENGAGKSTLLRIVAGVHRLTAGTVRVFGMDVDLKPVEVRRQLGFVPQDPEFHDWMTVAETLWFHSAFYDDWDTAYADELRAQVDLDPQRRIGELSRGMRTRLALVLAMAHRPPLLLLDEPLAGLDPAVRAEVIELVVSRYQDQEGGTLVISTHQASEIEGLIDELAILEQGRTLRAGSREALLESLRRVEIVFDGDAPPQIELDGLLRCRSSGQRIIADVERFSAGSAAALRSQGARDVSERRMNLEEAFVALARRRPDA